MASAFTADTVNVHEAKTHFSKLLERAHAGETIILAKGGTPYAKMVPLSDDNAAVSGKRRFGDLEHLNLSIPDSFFEPMSDEELRKWGLL